MQRQDTRGGRTLAFVLATFLLVVGFTALLRSRNMGGGGGAGGSAEQQQIAGGRESLAAAEAAAPQVAGTSAYSQELDQLDDDDPPLTHMFSASVGAPPALQEPPPGPIRMGGEGLEAFAEAAVRVAVDRTVAYVFVGYSMREFAVNWLLHASAVGVRGVVVGALDLAVADFLMRDPRIVRRPACRLRWLRSVATVGRSAFVNIIVSAAHFSPSGRIILLSGSSRGRRPT